jgi:5-methylcytosine-specific restriction endonuclease McrA
MSLDVIIKNTKKYITTCMKDNIIKSFITLVTFQQLTEIQNDDKINELKHPGFQTDFDENRVNEMIISYKKNPQFNISKILITIAIVKIDDVIEKYLVDGQHRMKMTKQLFEINNINDTMILAVHYIHNEEEMIELFNELNKDSTKNSTYVKLNIFQKIEMAKLKEKLKISFAGCYAKNIKNDSIDTCNEWIIKLYDHPNFAENKISIEIIENKHKIFFNKLQYLENSNNTKLFTKRELNIINEYKNVIFFKNNNFIDYLLDPDIKPYHEYINVRTNISNLLKSDIWKKEFGSKQSGKCPMYNCLTILDTKNFGFQCGHITSLNNKGATNLNNLRPICANCNSKMSSKNWHVYEEELKIFDIWSKNPDYNSDETTRDCGLCDKYIEIDNCYIFQNKKQKNILICGKCHKNKLSESNDKPKLKLKSYKI